MEITITFNDLEANTKQSDIITEWFIELINDKSPENLSPLRYADKVEVK